jgi:hypothetical protein
MPNATLVIVALMSVGVFAQATPPPEKPAPVDKVFAPLQGTWVGFLQEAHVVHRRRRRPGQVVRTMLRDSVWPIAIGTVAGIGGAALATRVIETFLYETTPTDPLTFAGVAAALAATGCLAALVPALRAARVDPASTLRTE